MMMQDDARTDLTSLYSQEGQTPSDDSISNLLCNRFKRNLPYTQLGYSHLVVVNPYQYLELQNDATLKSYAEYCYKDLSEKKPRLQPHIYEFATRIYFHMRRTGEDQSIIMSGITGSGKSISRSHFLKEIIQLSSHNKRENKLSVQIQNASVILEAFGHCQTSQNHSASKFGMFQEVQFNERGHILGTKTLAFQLDKIRVTQVRALERTFHVFYSLLAGTTTDEKNALHINFRPDYFYYLNQASSLSPTLTQADEIRFSDLKSALKLCGFKAKTVTHIFQVLAAILHIGNLQFTENTEVLSGAQEACVVKNTDVLETIAVMLGVLPSKLEVCLTYKLQLIGKEVCTAFLNTQAAAQQRDDLAKSLYNVLFLWIVETINKKLCYTGGEPASMIGILDSSGFQNFSSNGFEEFCVNLSNERIHQFLIQEEFNDNYGMNAFMLEDGIALPNNSFLNNLPCLELLVGKENHNKKEGHADRTQNNHNLGTTAASLGLGGISGLLDRDTAKIQSGATEATNANFLATLHRQFSNNQALSRSSHTYSFGINHFSGAVHYSVDMFLEKNMDDLSPDFVNLLRDGTSNTFISSLFQGATMATESHPKDDRTIIKAQLTVKPTRAPSMRRRPTKRKQPQGDIPPIPELPSTESDLEVQIRKAQDAYENMELMTVLDQLYVTLRDIFFTISETCIYHVVHIRPNDTQRPNDFDFNRARAQVKAFLIPELIVRRRVEYANYYTIEDFNMRYQHFLSTLQFDPDLGERDKVGKACTAMGWTRDSVFIGKEMIWLGFDVWKQLEDELRVIEKKERLLEKEALRSEAVPVMANPKRASGITVVSNDSASFSSPQQSGEIPLMDHYDKEQVISDGYASTNGQFEEYKSYDDTGSYGYYSEAKTDLDASQWDEESEWGIHGLGEGFGPNMDMSKMIEEVHAPQIENIEEVPITTVRRWWVRFVWFCTWWIPSPFLRWFGKMSRSDIQMAWREKVTLCIIIGFFSGVVLFFIVGLGEVVCPGTRTMYSTGDVQAHDQANDNFMSVRGNVYDMTQFARMGHGATGLEADESTMAQYAGLDVSASIPPPLTVACSGLVTNPTVKITPNASETTTYYIHYSGDQVEYSQLNQTKDPMWYWDTFLPTISDSKQGTLVHLISDLKADANGWGRYVIALYGKVYDIQDYMTTADTYASSSSASDYHFLSGAVEDIFERFRGTDATSKWEMYKDRMSVQEQQMNLNCLDNYFLIGYVDPRKDARCTFTNYLLLSLAVLMCLVTFVKFLAALQFGSKPTPEDHDKFVICQVPCYTEDEESLRKTIDSLTVMTYDDKRKLLFIIADGMIMGSGNDRPTPRIVLDVLGYDTKNDPEPLMFQSVGEGAKQLNYGKVYSGLYECEGHVVPYIVVAKVGKASERAKPGNRGKRDSQMICMNFLNRVHFDGEMTPMELEMYHQIKNVIGVNPSFYEYILMVDSDTEVMPHSLSYLISSMLHDGKVMGICGETALSNENQSWTTMIQVYEYYISHYLSKAFESLFGTVTCLPGCFCMYRIRTPVKNEPLIIAPSIVHDYSDNHADTLHKKNLLALGEDRYLTTLMMKHFPQYKMKFTPYAMCRTVAPDKWQVLLSQRRRWINSTIHNLFEVVLLPDLCGFCCFSMRFVVLIDLIGTLTLPVSFCYLVYLIYLIAAHSGPFPTLAIAMLAALYALQIILFVLKRQWQHIGWMFFYLLALPIYSFFLPVYSFWHFDDFSWGNTRVVVGDSQRKIIVTDDEKFDQKMIPMKKWSVYEQELWEMGSQYSRSSGRTYTSNPTSFSGMYGYDGYPPNMMMMPPGSIRSGVSDYDYYRDTRVMPMMNERSRHSYMNQNSTMSNSGSVIGAEYGQQTMGPMSDYMRNSEVSSPNLVQNHQQPMHFASNNGEYIHPQPMMMMPNDSGYNLYGGQQFDTASFQQTYSQISTPEGFPTDDDIVAEIQSILSTADLMSITKKQVREQLSNCFGFDMNIKKEFINNIIESILKGQL